MLSYFHIRICILFIILSSIHMNDVDTLTTRISKTYIDTDCFHIIDINTQLIFMIIMKENPKLRLSVITALGPRFLVVN